MLLSSYVHPQHAGNFTEIRLVSYNQSYSRRSVLQTVAQLLVSQNIKENKESITWNSSKVGAQWAEKILIYLQDSNLGKAHILVEEWEKEELQKEFCF